MSVVEERASEAREPIHQRRRQSPTRAVLALLFAAAGVGMITALVYLIRAGDTTGSNWPVAWQLLNSDSGVLYQVADDLFAGRELDWSFSGQVYVFPEIPISLVAYLVGAGGIYRYFVAVAVINNVLIFLTFAGIVRVRWRDATISTVIAKASLAMFPLVLLPLIGTTWVVLYHLGATYYLGMYLLVIGAPALFFVRSRWLRIVIGVAMALTAASNPLALVFAGPSFALTLIVRWVRHGFRSVVPPALVAVGVLILAAAIRLIFFASMQGTSPTNYMNFDLLVEHRLPELLWYFDIILGDPTNAVIVVVGVVCAVLCTIGAVVTAVRYLRDRADPRTDDDGTRLIAVYIGLVPLAGLLGTLALTITHYLYLWLILVAPMAFILAAVKAEWAKRALPVAAAGLVVAALITGAVPNLANRDQFFGFRPAETECLDTQLPEGMTVGYSTFSDARRLSLTSKRDLRLIQIAANGIPSYWLANRAEARNDTGTFFYINGSGSEATIDRAALVESFGEPDGEVTCGEGQYAIYYTDAEKIAGIRAFYDAHAIK